MSHLGSRIINLGFAFIIAVMSVNLSGVLSLQSAYADNNKDNNGGNNGTYQPVWCKITGSGLKAQLSANENGKDGALLMTSDIRNLNLSNVDNTIIDGNQVYAHDRSDKLDDACGVQYTITPPHLQSLVFVIQVTTTYRLRMTQLNILGNLMVGLRVLLLLLRWRHISLLATLALLQ